MTKPFDPTKPVQTRDGRKARILCTDYKGHRPIIAVLETQDGRENVFCYEISGKLVDGWEDGGDLINIPERTSRWAKISETTGWLYRGIAEDSWHPDEGKGTVLLEIISEDGKPVDVKLHKDEK